MTKPVLLALFLLLSGRTTEPQDNPCENMTIPVFTTEKDDRPITTLSAADLKLGNRSASMSIIGLQHDERRHRVILMLDVSGSMRGVIGRPLWPVATTLARHASYAGGENSDIALVLFSDHVLETIGFSGGRAAVQQRLGEVANDPSFPRPSKAGDSRIYDSLKKEILDLRDPTSADSLLLITDGGDEGSTARPDEILDLLSTSRVRVFTILVDPAPGSRTGPDIDPFIRMVKKSGGNVFGPINSENSAFLRTAKTAEANRVLGERLQQFYHGIFENDLLAIRAPFAIPKRQSFDLILTDSSGHKMKNAQIHFPNEIGPCSEIGSSR
jgi:hypothetical protein